MVRSRAGAVAKMSAWPLTTAVIEVASSSKRMICASLGAILVSSVSLVVPRVAMTFLLDRSAALVSFMSLGAPTTARMAA